MDTPRIVQCKICYFEKSQSRTIGRYTVTSKIVQTTAALKYCFVVVVVVVVFVGFCFVLVCCFFVLFGVFLFCFFFFGGGG